MTSPITTVTLVDGTVARAPALGQVLRARVRALCGELVVLDAERRAANVRLVAERRYGELLASLARADTAKGGDVKSASRSATPVEPSPYAQALADTGVTRQQAHRYQALAAVPKATFDEALRIQARAIRRCGELLRLVPTARGANQNIQEGSLPNVQTRERAASDAGLSERQRKTALRVAAVPDREFVDQVESDQPPTVTALASIDPRGASASCDRRSSIRAGIKGPT